VNRALRFNYK